MRAPSQAPTFSFHGSSCCLGHLAETRSSSERTLKSPLKRDQSLIGWRSQWSSSSREMENNVNNISFLDTHHPSTPISACKDMKAAVINTNNHSFVNQGAIAWNEMRREWLGDSSKGGEDGVNHQ